jgi:hypothetical protein
MERRCTPGTAISGRGNAVSLAETNCNVGRRRRGHDCKTGPECNVVNKTSANTSKGRDRANFGAAGGRVVIDGDGASGGWRIHANAMQIAGPALDRR